jgi:NhaA family Na+:H+ antiporter
MLVPLALAAWALVHASGVHATVAGVLLGFAVPVLRRDGADGRGLAEHLEHVVRPLSAAVAVPIFAFFSAGVIIDGWSGFSEALRDPITVGIVLGLFVGKTLGVFGATWVTATFTHARLDDDLSWWDVLGLSMLGGVGFTVSLLIGELAFGVGSEGDERAKIGVLVGSVVAAAAAAVVLRARNRVYRRIDQAERVDRDHDGIPDLFDHVDP